MAGETDSHICGHTVQSGALVVSYKTLEVGKSSYLRVRRRKRRRAAGGDRRRKLDYATQKKMGVVSHFVQGMEVGAKGLF